MKVHQFVHGYDKGHTELASSMRLGDDDSELVARLSDLSGSISSKGKIPSYLTSYPLQKAPLYAVAKTWMDLDAKRPGCVLTHTLLIPKEDWKAMREPSVLASLFKKPNRAILSDFTRPLEVIESTSVTPDRSSRVAHSLGLQFISKYFDLGIKPIVWVGLEDAEGLIWDLLTRIWPELRGSVSSCSYAIQPMMHAIGYFDWMFVPKKYSSNFDELKRDHFVTEGADRTPLRQEFWYREWYDQLFQTTNNPMDSAVLDLFKSLDADPTAIRLLYLLERQQELIPTHPTAAAGLLDLIETIAPQRTSSVELKTTMCIQALKVITAYDEPGNTIRVLRAIDDKLQREAFSDVSDRVRSTVEVSVRSLTRREPSGFLNCLEQMLVGKEPFASTYFIDGLSSGIEDSALFDDNRSLLRASEYPAAASFLVSRKPTVAAAFLNTSTDSRMIEDQIISWIDVANDSGALIDVLLPHVTAEWRRVIRTILQKSTEGNLEEVLSVLASKTNNFEGNIVDLVVENAAQRLPAATKDWCWKHRQSDSGVIQVLAQCYSPDTNGLELLLTDSQAAGVEKGPILAQFLSRCVVPYGPPHWLKDELRSSANLLSHLLLDPVVHDDVTAHLIDRLFRDVPEFAVPNTRDLIPVMPEFERLPFFRALREAVMKEIFHQYMLGNLSNDFRRRCEESAWAQEWFSSVSIENIKKVIRQSIDKDGSNIELAWSWVSTTSDLFFMRPYGVASGFIISLLDLSNQFWSEPMTDCFLESAQRVERCDRSGYERLCGASVRFCFSHTNFPVSRIVIKTFYPSYLRVIESKSDNFIQDIFDWDKGKEMRKSLVRAFDQSNWPAGDLALAAHDRKLLRKIVKRILVTTNNGQQYLDKMIVDLKKKQAPECGSVVEFLQDLRRNPSFYEDWY